MNHVPFHFLLLAIGEILRIYGYVTPQKLQTFISEDEVLRIKPKLEDCRLALFLAEEVGFILKPKLKGEYVRNCKEKGNNKRRIFEKDTRRNRDK